MLIRGLVALLVALALVVPLRAPEAEALPAGLPTHFAFGIGASPGDTWMPNTGIPWDFRFQYLAGGVNTNNGWETWNANGAFASGYATESAQHGYIPMFVYYELFQSNTTCGSCGENQRDLTNLNTPSLMNAYYANFALLMQRLGPGTNGFGKLALVNVEPDFAGGYAVQAVNNNSTCSGFCTGQGNDPSLLKASVASSGYAAVAGYPNTYLGFTQALAHLRDLYAPNVLLGYDVSPWAAGNDIGLDTSSSVNAAALGQQVGTFLSKVGPHDVLFNDPSDRDAGQYKYAFGQPTRFWDRLNVAFPNFTRWEQYLHGALAADGGKPMYLWQVPLGNQYFATENNTDGHYQDNRAEYIFGHVPELMQTGIVGAMFMAGNGGNTTYNDAKGDGTTNPASFCTTDGASSGQICNNHTSTVSDDDGGYVRMSAATYYKNPLPLSGGGGAATATPTATGTSIPATPTATASTTQATFTTGATASPTSFAPGATVNLTSTVKSTQATSALVDLEVYDAGGTRVFQQFWDNQAFSAGQSRTFSAAWQSPNTAATGGYSIAIGVFSPGWGTVYGWNGTAGSFTVGAAAATNTPTAVPPTSTPTTRPTNTPTATPTSGSAQRGFTTSSVISPTTVTRPGAASISTSVKSATATSALIDVEIYNAAGTRVFQQFWDNQSFSAGQTHSFNTSYSIPGAAATGTYTVMVGVFSPGWGAVYAWNSQSGTFGVR